MSTSRNWALWAPEIEDRYQPDAIRYYLIANGPETRDSNWSWADFVQRVNSELVATWGNLANRVLSITHRTFGVVPQPGALTDADRQLIAATQQTFESVTGLLDGVKLRAALNEAMALAQAANQYLSEQEPWKLVKSDQERAATVLFVALRTVDTLKMLFCPFLPFSSQRLHELLGYTGTIAPQPQVEETQAPDGSPRLILTGDYAASAAPGGLACWRQGNRSRRRRRCSRNSMKRS